MKQEQKLSEKLSQTYFRVIDTEGLSTVKEGTKWIWNPGGKGDNIFLTIDEKKVTGPNRQKIIDDLDLAILRDQVEYSDTKQFPRYVSKEKREERKKKLDDKISKKLYETKQTKTQTTNQKTSLASNYNVPYTAPSVNLPEGKKTTSSKSFVKKVKLSKTKEHEVLSPPWDRMTEKERQEMFVCAYRWLHGNVDKVNQTYKSMSSEERFTLMDDFIYDGLMKKDDITDDVLPSLHILEKIPGILNDRSLLLYYKRRILRKEGMEKEEHPFMLRNGLPFNTKNLPTSWKYALGTAGVAFMGGRLAVKGISSTVSGIHSMISSLSKRESTNNQIPELNQPQQRNSYSNIVKTRLFGTEQDMKTNREMLRMFGTGMLKIMEEIKKALPHERKLKASEDVSVKEAKNIIGTDNSTLHEKVYNQIPEFTKGERFSEEGNGKEDKKEGILSKLMELLVAFETLKHLPQILKDLVGVFTGMKNILKGFVKFVAHPLSSFKTSEKSAVKELESDLTKTPVKDAEKEGAEILKKVPEAKPSLLSKIGKFARVGGKALGVVGAAIDVGSGIHQLVEGKQQTSMPSGWNMLDPMKWGMYAGHSINETFKDIEGESLGNKVYDWLHPNQKSMKVTPFSVKKQTKTLDNITNSSQAMKNLKEDQRTKSIVDASTKASTTIIQQANTGIRLWPRTQDNTLTKYIDSRAKFA